MKAHITFANTELCRVHGDLIENRDNEVVIVDDYGYCIYPKANILAIRLEKKVE